VDKVREAYRRMVEEGYDEEYARGVVTYLGLAIDKVIVRTNSLSLWDNTREDVASTFGRQALPMVWDYIETNAVSETTGGYTSALGWVNRVLEHCTTATKF